MDKRTAIRTSKYEVIDAGKLKFDVKSYCEHNRIRQCDFYDEIGIGKSPLSNAVHTAENNTSNIDFSRYEKCEQYGYIQKIFLIGICNHAGLNIDDYIVKEKAIFETSPATDKKDIEQVAINFYSKAILQELHYMGKAIKSMKEWQVGIQNTSISLSHIDKKLDTLIDAINTLGKVEAQNMEYLKNVADGIQTMNDKYNKPSAYIRK